MGTNHAFALWFTARTVKPNYIIESGVWCGQGSWLLRKAAGPHVIIFSLDPRSKSLFSYKEDGYNNTHRYFTGTDFKDLSEVDWDLLIPVHERDRVLVVLDDHQACTKRVSFLLSHGFMHVFYDDNYNYLHGGRGDVYGFNTVCAPVPRTRHNQWNMSSQNRLIVKDDFARINWWISRQTHHTNVEFIRRSMDVYFEFPPVFDGCSDTRVSTCRFTLCPKSLVNESRLASFGLPPLHEDPYHYQTEYPAYVKLKSHSDSAASFNGQRGLLSRLDCYRDASGLNCYQD